MLFDNTETQIKEVSKELKDYYCIYKSAHTHFIYIYTLGTLKDLPLTKDDVSGKVYIEKSLMGSEFCLYDAEEYLGMPISFLEFAPKDIVIYAPEFFFNYLNTKKYIRVVPELSESSKDLFSKIETMQTTYQPETNNIEEDNMQEINNLNAMMKNFNTDLNVDIPTWLNTQPTLVWKLDKDANVMLFADEQFDTFTLKDVKNDISFNLTFDQVKNLGIIYNANYD